MKYTRDDVIIWPDDPRLKDAIGKKCIAGFSPAEALWEANQDWLTDDDDIWNNLVRVEDNCMPFVLKTPLDGIRGEYWKACGVIILKKESKKKLVAFDLDDYDDRRFLTGKVITNSQTGGTEEMITTFMRSNGKYECWLRLWDAKVTGDMLLKDYQFLDGRPVGKEVEE